MKTIIKTFRDISIKDLELVGGKNASLGEMYNKLRPLGIHVPDGFAVTAPAFRMYLDHYRLKEKLNKILGTLDTQHFSNLHEVGERARGQIMQFPIPKFIAIAIEKAYKQLGDGDKDISVAVRSSATAEDLPSASFAGQLESYLNVSGLDNLLQMVHRCFASLYTDRVINYRHQQGFGNIDVAISVGVQKMVRADKAASGVAFTLDPETGHNKLIIIDSIFGLGENIVQGRSTPDEFVAFKPHIGTAFNPIIQSRRGRKEWTMVYGDGDQPVMNLETPADKQAQYSIAQKDVITLAEWCLKIEKHYKKPMDIEWAKDGETGELFITQARPETVHASKKTTNTLRTYQITAKGNLLTSGIAVGEKIVSGKARLLHSAREAGKLQQGEILVTDITNPDWDPIMKRAAGIITNKGGRTSHAAIVARELGAAAIVGCGNATEVIKDGDEVTMSCVEGKTGFIYQGRAHWTVSNRDLGELVMPATDPMLILADPAQAFDQAMLPQRGAGLVRMEFIITHNIKVHPLALTRFSQLTHAPTRAEIENLTRNYPDKPAYFVEKLAQGLTTIAAAFHPHDVIVRMSDFKSNEYANLLGGQQFEPKEENPMLGFRGASRYYSALYKDGFELECRAIKKVREEMGFKNVKVMIPFCRTVHEAERVMDTLREFGLARGENGLEVYVMIEIPSNVMLAEQFATIFDGFSIGSNDLTQLTLGIDRDSELVSGLFNEMNPAVLQLIATTIHVARRKNVKVGLCGQAPSDMPEFARFLVEQGIDSISFNPDALLKGVENIALAEGLTPHKPRQKTEKKAAKKAGGDSLAYATPLLLNGN